MYVAPATLAQMVVGLITVLLTIGAGRSNVKGGKRGMLEPVAVMAMGITFSLSTILWGRIEGIDAITFVMVRILDGLLNYGLVEMSWALRSSILNAAKFAKLKSVDNGINVVANMLTLTLASSKSDAFACGVIGCIMLALHILLCLFWMAPAGRRRILLIERTILR